jgi:predicted transcriptional regulator of viral defense system
MTDKTSAYNELIQAVKEQQGYFTSRQAVDAGYSEKNHAYHVNSGAWIREERGIYRFSHYPDSDDAGLVLWSLWSRNRKGEIQGVYSHLTALRIHGLTDANPAKLHMTVPPEFRRSGATPKVLVLHRARLESRDVEGRKGFSVTVCRRTLEDLAEDPGSSDALLKQGLAEGMRSGLMTIAEVEGSPVLRRMRNLAVRSLKRRG